MTPQEIRAALILRGITQRDIARKEGVSYSAVSMTIHGTLKSPRLRKAIADAIGRPVREVFPPEEQVC